MWLGRASQAQQWTKALLFGVKRGYEVQRVHFTALIVCTIVSALSSPMGAWGLKNLLDAPQGDRRQVIASSVVLFIGTLLTVKMPPRIAYHRGMIERCLSDEFGYELAKRLGRESGLVRPEQSNITLARQAQYSPLTPLDVLTNGIQFVLVLVTYAGLLVAMSGWIAAGVILSIFPKLAQQLYVGWKTVQQEEGQKEKILWQAYYTMVVTQPAYAKPVQAFGLADWFLYKLRQLQCEIRSERNTLARSDLRGQSVVDLIPLGVMAITLTLVVSDLLEGRGELGNIAITVGAIPAIQGSTTSLVREISQAFRHLRRFKIYQQVAMWQLPMRRHTPYRPVEPLRHSIMLKDVSFRYGEKGPWALRHLNLTLHAGEVVALIGRNGAGKTTLSNLLLRFWDPTEGQILWDGVDIRCFDPEEYRRHLGIVFQEPPRFDGSIQENIGMGRIEACEDREMIQQVAKDSGAHTFIDPLPSGYDTLLGMWVDGGITLSGGQWQRLALASFFLREGASLLLLDEPTAAMDPRTERQVFDSLWRHLRGHGHTTVLIVHRMRTAKEADRIIVLDSSEEGSAIVEDGAPDELLRREGGHFRDLYELEKEGEAA